ncbi:hypothetical protein TNCV_1426141 [Trichonephila clavipes]|nr:hypothetical protein TNCV_1426141 [Trichonephila clavipes]
MNLFHSTRNKNRLTRKDFPSGIETEPTLEEMFGKVSVLLHYPTASSKEFVAVDDDNVRAVPIMVDIWSLFKASKVIVEADFNDENEMNNTTPVSTSS